MSMRTMKTRQRMASDDKRLCSMAAKETRETVQKMCQLAIDKCPEFDGLLVPMCEYNGGICHEMNGGCGRCKNGNI